MFAWSRGWCKHVFQPLRSLLLRRARKKFSRSHCCKAVIIKMAKATVTALRSFNKTSRNGFRQLFCTVSDYHEGRLRGGRGCGLQRYFGCQHGEKRTKTGRRCLHDLNDGHVRHTFSHGTQLILTAVRTEQARKTIQDFGTWLPVMRMDS